MGDDSRRGGLSRCNAVIASQAHAPNRYACLMWTGALQKAGGAKIRIGDGAASCALKAPTGFNQLTTR